jgi:hypothetical protein
MTIKVFHLSITQRLWLGLGVLLALFAGAALVSMRATHSLDDTLSHLVTDGDTRTAAAYDMNMHLDAIARAVANYLQSPEPPQRERIKSTLGRFERGLSNYKAVATEEQSRVMAAQLSTAYARYKKLVDEVVRATEAQTSRVAA